jgi:hypothetical protein
MNTKNSDDLLYKEHYYVEYRCEPKSDWVRHNWSCIDEGRLATLGEAKKIAEKYKAKKFEANIYRSELRVIRVDPT